MEVGREASPKGKGKGKSTKQAAVLKTDNRTETPEIKKDEGVENPDKDALESTDADAVDVPDTEAEGSAAPSTEDAENQEPLAGDTGTGDGKNDGVATVLEVHVERAGTGRFVDEALERARDNEKQAFQNLINENVKTQSELDKTSARLADIEAQLGEKTTELEAEQEKNRELRGQVHDLETTVKQYEEEKRRAAAEAAAAEGTTGEAGDESKPPESGEEENKNDEFITTEQKLKDLQLRLKRMARDEEEKDQYVADLTRQLKVSEDVLDDIEPHVDKVRWQEVMDKRRTALEEQTGEPVAAAEWLGSDNVVRRSDGVAKSKICVIM